VARVAVRRISDLGLEIALAPERHVALGAQDKRGVPLSALVVERVERVMPRELTGAVVLDTTHAKDGVLDMRAARASGPASSAKKRVREGDLLVSRLRPYLRQIGFAHPACVRKNQGSILACSTEFYVLASPNGEDLAFLVPFLLGRDAQSTLAAGQEGGHHPRVPFETVLGLRVPSNLVASRVPLSRRVRSALLAVYRAGERYVEVLTKA
jgi:hypothetical protein